MKKTIPVMIIVLALSLYIPATAFALCYESAGGKPLDSNIIRSKTMLKKIANELCAPDDSDHEKVRKINKYVCDKAEYDYSGKSGGLVNFALKNKVVCSGYAEALAYMLDCVNVKNFTLTGYVNNGSNSKILHIWNVVYLDGQWLHVDPTWNDATRSGGYPNGRCFLIPADQMCAERQISLQTAEDYSRFYDFIKTIRVSFSACDSFIRINGAKRELSLSEKPYSVSPDNPGGENIFLLKNSKILAPMREIAWSLGCYVGEDGRNISIILGTRTLEISADSKTGYIDGEEFTFDVPPQVINGNIMIPVRTVFEKLGAEVTYDALTNEVIISYDPYHCRN